MYYIKLSLGYFEKIQTSKDRKKWKRGNEINNPQKIWKPDSKSCFWHNAHPKNTMEALFVEGIKKIQKSLSFRLLFK